MTDDSTAADPEGLRASANDCENAGLPAAAYALGAAAAEVERLRALIEDAPHQDLCLTNLGYQDPCDCWKSQLTP